MAEVKIEGRVDGSRGRGKPRRQWEDDLKQERGWSVEGLRKSRGGKGAVSEASA